MPSTPLHHKPIFYGSDAADLAFYVLVVIHVLPALVAPLSGIVAFASKKGGTLHLTAGRWFVRSMAAVAVTGILLDAVRLFAFVRENHTKYAGYSMPSSYPARLGFLYAALAVLYLLWEATPPRVFRLRREGPSIAAWAIPALLLAIGVALTAVIVLRFNPWTGALWMIFTFMLVIAINARGRLRLSDRASAVGHHRYGMAFLAAFSWWGALQGFGPAIGIAIQGRDPSTTPYTGDQPGPFGLGIAFFLVGWAPLFLLGLFLLRRFKARAGARRAVALAGSDIGGQ